jgi:hypothetical protein
MFYNIGPCASATQKDKFYMTDAWRNCCCLEAAVVAAPAVGKKGWKSDGVGFDKVWGEAAVADDLEILELGPMV